MKNNKRIFRITFVLAALLTVSGMSFAQGRPPPRVRQIGLEAPPPRKEGHAVGVVGGKVHTSSVTLYIRDPNAPAKTSTITVDIETRRVVRHDGCPEGGCNLTDWKVKQGWGGKGK